MGGKVGDILDYDYVKHLEEVENIKIRHNKQPEDELTSKDMTAAGVMMQQMWVVADTHAEVAQKQMEIYEKIYKIKQEGNDYPAHWLELAGKEVPAEETSTSDKPGIGILSPQPYMMTALDELKSEY